jgi:hypothetical protein
MILFEKHAGYTSGSATLLPFFLTKDLTKYKNDYLPECLAPVCELHRSAVRRICPVQQQPVLNNQTCDYIIFCDSYNGYDSFDNYACCGQIQSNGYDGWGSCDGRDIDETRDRCSCMVAAIMTMVLL